MKKDIFDKFNEAIDDNNNKIEIYRKLAPNLMPVIKIFQKEIKSISLSLNYCSLTFKKFPDRIYHVLDENGLTGEPNCNSGLSYSFGDRDDIMTVSLK